MSLGCVNEGFEDDAGEEKWRHDDKYMIIYFGALIQKRILNIN